MAGIHEISAYQQSAEAWKTEQKRIDSAKTTETAKTAKSETATDGKASKVSLKPWKTEIRYLMNREGRQARSFLIII